MVRLMYETAADSTDVITWTRDNLRTRKPVSRGAKTAWEECEANALGGVSGIDFDRGKTNHEGNFIPISADLAQEIRENATLYLVTDPFGRPYQPVIDDARLRGHMTTLREQVVKREGPVRTYDHLRHSAVTEAAECGFDADAIANLSTHKGGGMNREVYIQRSAAKTYEIQRARGIVE